jgi:hypothetical protein
MALNPYIANIFIDSCAFDPKYEPESSCSNEILTKSDNGEINLIISHSNLKEAEHPNTPPRLKAEANSKTFTDKTSLTHKELSKKKEIWNVLTGNGKPENMLQDANHVFEAHQYGDYFVTTDNRILKRRDVLNKICSAIILKPCELVALLDEFKNS